MKYALIVIFILTSGCASLYPVGGAIIGGGAGSLAGPAGAALGAGAGALTGQVIAKDREADDLKDQIKAITQGDVQKLIEIQAKEHRGTFDKIVDGIYRMLWLGGVCMLLWFVIPWIWAKGHVKKAVEKHINGNGK